MIRSATIALSLLVGATVGCSVVDPSPVLSPPPEDSRPTYVSECWPDRLLQAPTSYYVICTGKGRWVEQITWSDWGKPIATGRGTAWLDKCNPCNKGHFTRIPVELTLSDLTIKAGSGIYYRVRMKYLVDPPPGEPRVRTHSLGTHRVASSESG